MIDWNQITIMHIIDLVVVALMTFYAYRLLRKSGAVYLFWGIFAFVAAWLAAKYMLHLPLTGALFDQIVSVGAIAIIVIFQSEIRTFFYNVGARFGYGLSALRQTRKEEALKQMMDTIAAACISMARTKTGALIVIERGQELAQYEDTGEKMDAIVSERLIENIFFKNSPLHDGALLIRRGRATSAACILPVTSRQDLPQQYGLRHRAAFGITERTDAMAVVVSEETGHISVAVGDTMKRVQEEDLAAVLLSSASVA